jgi:hypothetical protein
MFYKYEVYQKDPRLAQKRNAELSDSILAAVSFKILSLGTYTATQLLFPCFKSTMEVIFINAVWVPLGIPFECQTLLQNVVPSV